MSILGSISVYHASVFGCTGAGRERDLHLNEVCVVNLFASLTHWESDLAAQGLAESEIGIATRCATSMSDDVFVFHASAFAAQGLVGSDIGI